MGDLQCTTSGLCVEAGDEALSLAGGDNEEGEAASIEGARETEGASSDSGCAASPSSSRGIGQTSVALLILTLLAIYRRRRSPGY